jgi:UDP-2,3-diacylglucosamine hydrolase
MYLNIKSDAIFIADSHYNTNRTILKDVLEDIISFKISTNQLFLMGDIFDFLSDDVTYFQNQNKDIIKLINKLSKSIEIIYLEGNHDFNLSSTFSNLLLIPRDTQPLICKYKDKKVSLAHGDIFMPTAYNIYTKIIRLQITGFIINLLDIKHILLNSINRWLLKKNICGNITNFNSFAQTRINKYKKLDIDIIIEGHYHQDKRFKNYINLPSLICNGRYFEISEL